MSIFTLFLSFFKRQEFPRNGILCAGTNTNTSTLSREKGLISSFTHLCVLCLNSAMSIVTLFRFHCRHNENWDIQYVKPKLIFFSLLKAPCSDCASCLCTPYFTISKHCCSAKLMEYWLSFLISPSSLFCHILLFLPPFRSLLHLP